MSISEIIKGVVTGKVECFGCENEIPIKQIAYAFESLFFGHIMHKYVCKACKKKGLTTRKAMKMDSGDDDAMDVAEWWEDRR